MDVSAPIRVLLVEDDARLRRSLRLLLDSDPRLHVVGDVGTARDALALPDTLVADVAVVDLGLPDGSGVDVIRAFKDTRASLDIMAHTVFDERGTVLSALKAGASSYVLKGCAPEELIDAVVQLHEGGAPMSPSIARQLVEALRAPAEADEPDPLSPREREVLRAIDAGRTYAEVAATLHISPHTVHTHIKNIYAALQASGKRQALAEARRRGLI